MNLLKKPFALLIVLGAVFTAPAYTQNISWQKSLGGSSYEAASSVQQTQDGGYIVAGTSGSSDGDVTGNHGGYDYWVAKLDSTGNTTWKKTFGGTSSDWISSIKQTQNGGYIIAGWSFSNDGDVTGNHGTTGTSDYWIVKLDSTGNITWEKTLGGTGDDVAKSIQQTQDGGYIIAGYSSSTDGDVTVNHGGNNDYWVVKLAPETGTSTPPAIEWQKSLGGSGDDVANSIQQTQDGGYIVAGSSSSTNDDVIGNNGSRDYWVVKLDPTGNITWQKSLGGSGTDVANSIQQTSDLGYIIAGTSSSTDGQVTGNHGFLDYWIAKLDAKGSITWQKSFGGSDFEVANSIQQTQDGGYIVAGWTDSTDGDIIGSHGADFWILKLDPAGNMTWQKCFGGSYSEVANSIQQTSDLGYIIAGDSKSNDGDTTNNNGDSDYWVVKLNPTTGIKNSVYTDAKITVYPNLVSSINGSVNIKTDNITEALLTITNAVGQVVYSNKVSTNDITFDVNNYSKGIYLIKVQGKYKNTKQEIFKIEKFIVQ